MSDSKKITILYVEDEQGIRNSLGKFLKNFASELYIAVDGEDGLEQYKKYKPDLVISDIQMPKMDGLEMAQAIKNIDGDQYLIFTTAFSNNEFFIKAINLQVDGYILKPLDLEKCEEKILQITRQIEIRKDLTLKNQMLIQQSKLASMGEMIGNIAHQWRQPLSIISTSASGVLVQKEFGSLRDDDLEDMMNNIVKSCNYLSQTIDDFRNFFKPSSDNKFVANLHEFMGKSIDLVASAFKDNFIEVIKDIDLDIDVYGDSNQLSQAIINILNNAKDALKSAEQNKEKMILIATAKKDEDNIIITIQDNAGGIPEDICERIFEPYFTTKHQSQGTGLGLYITHQIITKNLNGTISVENKEFEHKGEKYKGALFTLTLPICKDGL